MGAGALLRDWALLIRQGVAADALLELDYPSLSVFGDDPFGMSGSAKLPVTVLQMAASAVVKGYPDGRLAVGSTDVFSNLDGCACGPSVLLGSQTQTENAPIVRDAQGRAADSQDWRNRTELLYSYMTDTANRTTSGALSHRGDVLTCASML